MSDQPRVWSKRNPGVPKGAVYVGRPSKWGNPYVIGRDGTREQVIEKYRQWAYRTAPMGFPGFHEQVARELRGKHLVCWCAPLPCHADVLLEIANGK